MGDYDVDVNWLELVWWGVRIFLPIWQSWRKSEESNSKPKQTESTNCKPTPKQRKPEKRKKPKRKRKKR